jgi:hypothetical protein
MNQVKYDSCVERGDNETNRATSDYIMNVKAVTRSDVSPTAAFGLAQGRDFYGAFDASRAKKESFLQGRGQPVSNCAECEVITLPESLFPTTFEETRPAGSCINMDLERMMTSSNKSANSLSEAEVWEYTSLPGAYQKGYTGYNSVVNTNMQTRMMSLAPPKSSCGRPLSYATYGIGEGSGRYGRDASMIPYA